MLFNTSNPRYKYYYPFFNNEETKVQGVERPVQCHADDMSQNLDSNPDQFDSKYQVLNQVSDSPLNQNLQKYVHIHLWKKDHIMYIT